MSTWNDLSQRENKSEYIKKFSGTIVDRTILDDNTTSIMAKDRAYNYDEFLDFIDMPQYPANARDVAIKCATHLGLTLDNPNDIINQHVVEFPNVLTVVQVLQNIAGLSGGNFIITEDDKLRLVVTKNPIDPQIFPAQNYSDSPTIQPISKVRVYYDDQKAFESGDDSGTLLEVDNKWATQQSTDYMLSVLGGYVYQASKGDKVYIDPAYQLGDYISYGNITQLLANVKWIFDKTTVANIDAPISADNNFDDPYANLMNQQFKKLVTLGDNYQGISLSREKGIEMLQSPDGREENAVGKFYADLNRGMAFQYRDSAVDEWEDWLYFDTNEKRFKLMLSNGEGDIDSKFVSIEADLDGIRQEVKTVHNGNEIIDINGDSDYVGWYGKGRTLYTQDMIDNGFKAGFTYGTIADPIEIENSKNGIGWSFYNSGEMFSPKGRLIKGNKYAFRGKVINFKPIKINVFEYNGEEDANGDLKVTKTTPYSFTTPGDYIEFRHTPEYDSEYVSLGIEVPTATLHNTTDLTEMMFNIGEPKDWFASSDEAIKYARATREILANEIRDVVEEVDEVSGNINNTTVKINPHDGVLIQNNNGRGLTVLNNDGQPVIFLNADGTLHAVDGVFTGSLLAGDIAGFTFDENGIMFPDGQMRIDSKKSAIMAGNTGLYYGGYNNFVFVDPNIQTPSGDSKTVQIFGDGRMSVGTLTGGVDRLTIEGSGLYVNTHFGNVDYDCNILRIKTRQGIEFNGYLSLNSQSPFDNTSFSTLGDPSRRYQYLYLRTQPNVSSDMRIKKNILPIDDKFIRMFGEEVEPKMYVGKEDGENHFGYIAQDVERLLYRYISKYGSNKSIQELKETVKSFSLLHKDETFMSLLYGEIAVIVDAYHRMKYKELEERILKLEKGR